MKFSLGWLKQHLETEAPVEAIAGRLTMIGFEVEDVVDRAKDLAPFVVGRVVEAAKHPAAERLTVCKVDTGSGVVQVVCGAPNARAGMKGVFAPPGSYVPGTGVHLKTAVIRGVESHGMLLSEREMRLGDEHAGIVELADDAPVGARAADAMGLADPVFDVAVTANRGDCLGVRGIARELAAAGLGRLKPLPVTPVPGSFDSPVQVRLEFAAGEASACPYFVGRAIRGLRNGESPRWLKDRLLAVGLRPISALVDITNLITLDLNRPLHAFDLGKLAGDITVRLSRAGERLLALNGREYALDDSMTAIADSAGVLALGGVIGGASTGCTAETRDAFLESAYFDPVRTAATGRKLNLTSDARFRFERGVDPGFVADGMEAATRLVIELCGGEPSRLVVAGRAPGGERAVPFRWSRVESLAGVEVPAGEGTRILGALGFRVDGAGESMRVQVPSWRADVVGEACLVEEIVRIHGYDRIPATPFVNPSGLPEAALADDQRRRAIARRALAARGLVEAVTFSFVKSAHARLFGGVPDSLRLVNPISADLDAMRPSLLPGLVSAAGRNADRGLSDVALFEVGPCYAGDGPEDQAQAAAGVRAGLAGGRHWAEPSRPVDAFDAKADVEHALAALGVAPGGLAVETQVPPWYHPGRAGLLRLGPGAALAAFGEIHPAVLKEMDVKGPVAGFEIFLDRLPRRKERTGAARAAPVLSPLQPVVRDFAFVVDKDVSAGAVAAAASGAERGLIERVSVFDVFAGSGLAAGKKSVAIAVALQPRDKTLTEAEIEAVAGKIVAAVGRATGGVLRT